MGKLKGLFQITGSVGNLTFCQTRTGIIVRQKSGINKQRIRTDGAFKRTREWNEEFGRAGRYCKIITNAFPDIISECNDRTVRGRLMSILLKAIKADTVSKRGERHLTPEGIKLLEAFEFNQAKKLCDVLREKVILNYNKKKRIVTARVKPFVSVQGISMPQNAAYYKIAIKVACIDLEKGETFKTESNTFFLDTKAKVRRVIPLTCQLSEVGNIQVWVVMSVQFFSLVNGQYYAKQSSTAASILKVW